MKIILSALLVITLLMSCVSGREVQAEIVSAQLVRIDTVYRYPNMQEQLLTWKSPKNVEYISYASIYNSYVLGVRMPMLIAK